MKVELRLRLRVLIVERNLRTAKAFGEAMTAAGHKLSHTQAARYVNADPPPAMTLAFIETACVVLKCMPNDLFEITVVTEPEEPPASQANSTPANVTRIEARPSKPGPSTETSSAAAAREPGADHQEEAQGAPSAPATTVPWAGKYGVAGPKMRALPTRPED